MAHNRDLVVVGDDGSFIGTKWEVNQDGGEPGNLIPGHRSGPIANKFGIDVKQGFDKRTTTIWVGFGLTTINNQ